jgi:hypothetical protein
MRQGKEDSFPGRGELMTDEPVTLFSRDYKLAALRQTLAEEWSGISKK